MDVGKGAVHRGMGTNVKRRICIFCETWESGGIESFLSNTLLHMDTAGMEIDIVAEQLRESVFTQGLKAKGIRFRELSGSVRKFSRNYSMFRRLLRERNYDAVHVNAFQGMSLYYLHMAQQTGVPIRIAHSHNTDLRKSHGRRFKLLLHGIFRRRYTRCATALWACSEAAARFLFDAGTVKRMGYTFIPNGIDIGRFRFRPEIRERIRAELGLSDRLVQGNVGRLCSQKNQSFLLDILERSLPQHPEFFLLLVGEGEDRKALEEKAGRLGVSEHVLFCGATSHVEELLWAMDVFLFPSLFEGFGIVALEAQAAGLPVLCSEHVAKEALATPLAQVLPLTDGPARWAEAVQFCSGSASRNRETDLSAYDITRISVLVRDMYTGK